MDGHCASSRRKPNVNNAVMTTVGRSSPPETRRMRTPLRPGACGGFLSTAQPARATISNRINPVPAAMVHHKDATERVTSLAGSRVDKGLFTHAVTRGKPKRNMPDRRRRHTACSIGPTVLRPFDLDTFMKKLGRPLPLSTPTAVSIMRHPIHPMVVPFPIAFLLAIVGTDLAFLFTDVAFCAR